jgi:2-polyprenyl-3-methyl-5-hydroxy-6-metoxy-1,4-benzoquinol methylase
MSSSLAEARWEQEYLDGKYTGEQPIPFTTTIIDMVGNLSSKAAGIYVGCGNGRNFVPLIDAGLDIKGIDISKTALEQIRERRPELPKERLVWGDFLDVADKFKGLDYLVSLQVFQHGETRIIEDYFEASHEALRRNGLLFLRVNSVSTEILHKHTVTAMNPEGGQTVRYLEGPKQGMDIHFYSEAELAQIAEDNNFAIKLPLTEVVMQRPNAGDGHWTQWETVWRAV